MTEKRRPGRPLTAKQRLFIAAYLENGMNATRAAQAAGYSGTYFTVAQMGHENLKNPQIKRRIEAKLRERIMGADEVLARLSEHASASLDEFIDENGTIDLKTAREHGAMHLLHKLYQKPNGEIRIEMHDQQAALNTLAKYHKLLATQIEVVDWRKEAESLGIPSDSLFGNAIAEVEAALGDDVIPTGD